MQKRIGNYIRVINNFRLNAPCCPGEQLMVQGVPSEKIPVCFTLHSSSYTIRADGVA